MRLAQALSALTFSLFVLPDSALAAGTALEQDCGAAGDGCASAEYQAYEMAAVKAFTDWPEVGYRTYASLCSEADAKIKKLCLSNPVKAAKLLKLPPDE